MVNEKLLALLKKLGINLEGKEKVLEDELKSLEPAPQTAAPKSNDMPKNELNEDVTKLLQAEIQELRATLAGEVQYRKQIAEMQKQKAETEMAAKIDGAVSKLFSEKKISEAQKDIWKNLFAKDYENADKLASSLPEQGKAVSTTDAGAGKKASAFETGSSTNMLGAIRNLNEHPVVDN